MTSMDPVWALTDDALDLILHAEHDIIEHGSDADASPGSLRIGRLGGTKTANLWRQETAVLRLISTVEAYTEAASRKYFAEKRLAVPKMPLSWPLRIKFYKDQHQIDIEECDGWPSLKAGIDLRNCLAHGLGNLTEILIAEQDLGVKMRVIDVYVGGNRMHYTSRTVPILAAGCRCFVLNIEKSLVSIL